MKLLLDECIPWKVKFLFTATGRTCDTVPDAGLSGKENGELLALIENRYDVLITIDKNIPYQQNMAGRKLSLLIIRPASNDIDDIRPHVPAALAALQSIRPGEVIQISGPVESEQP